MRCKLASKAAVGVHEFGTIQEETRSALASKEWVRAFQRDWATKGAPQALPRNRFAPATKKNGFAELDM